MKTFFCITLFITCLIFPFSGYSQEPTNTENIISVKTTLVNIPLIISDKTGRRIADIKKEDVSVFEGNQKLDIEFFADSNEPINFAIVIDTSGSTRSVIGKIKNVAKQFVSTMGQEDKGIVFSFDESVNELMNDFSSDHKKLRNALNIALISESPGSVMNDALERLIQKQFADLKGRKAIIVLTDGDVDGKASRESMVKMYAQSDILLYPIFYQTRPLFPRLLKSVSFDEFIKVEPVNYLFLLAKVTGGRLLVAEDNNFETAFRHISDELRKQYVVGFYVDADSEAESRNISIKVNRPDAVIRTKSSIKVISSGRPLDR